MTWRIATAIAMTTLFLASPLAAQTKGRSPAEPTPPKGDAGSGNRPPGTPSAGDKGTPVTQNPTAPCPAGTSRLNLGEDCKPLSEQGKKPKK
jgi:hypothetical protein